MLILSPLLFLTLLLDTDLWWLPWICYFAVFFVLHTLGARTSQGQPQ
jgi:hypothetical protein